MRACFTFEFVVLNPVMVCQCFTSVCTLDFSVLWTYLINES